MRLDNSPTTKMEIGSYTVNHFPNPYHDNSKWEITIAMYTSMGKTPCNANPAPRWDTKQEMSHALEDPLSNHYPTPIQAFDQEFRSLEHAFFWKMTTDLEKHELAARIKAAAHAGVAKRLSKEMAEEEREAWDHENVHVMRTLLQQKAKTCMEFRNKLLLNKVKILAESTINKRWGTGLPKFVTEVTELTLWPGTNLLGKLLMELTSQLTSSGMDIEYAVDGGSDSEEGEVDDCPAKCLRDNSLRDNNKGRGEKGKDKKILFQIFQKG